MSSTTTVRAYPAPEPTPNIAIDFSPHGNPYSYTVGEETYAPANTFYARLNTEITLTATVTFYVTGQLAVGYEWRLGDGSTAATNPVVHTYTLGSEIPVTLIVTDNRGIKHRAYKTLYLRKEANALEITGTPMLGQTLTSIGGHPTPTYQWQKATTSEGTYSNISGATNSFLFVTESLLADYIRLQVTEGTTETSNVIGPIVEPPFSSPVNTVRPSLPEEEAENFKVTVTNGTWLNSPTSYAYKWQVSPTGSAPWENIPAQTTQSLGQLYLYSEEFIRCVVTATNESGSASATSTVCYIYAVHPV